MEIVLDFEMTDKSGNKANLGTDSSQIISKSNIVCNGGSSTLTMKKYDDHYQLIIKVTKAATYTIIKNSYMSESIKFTVVSGGIDASASYCTLDGYTSIPTLKIGDKVKFNCYFKDGRGKDVTIQRFKEISEYNFSCEVRKTSPNTKTTQASYNDKTNFYQVEYTITENGIFIFSGYLTYKTNSSNRVAMTGRVIQIYVSSDNGTLNKSVIYNYYAKKWVSIDNAVIEYANDKNGALTAIDLADSTGTLMSSYKTYPTNFDDTKIQVEFYSDHDRNFKIGEYVAKVFTLDGIQYVGIFNKEAKESDLYLRRSSFDFTLKITYQSITKVVTFRYNKNYLGISSYTTCFHDLDLSKTKVNIDKNVQIKADGSSQKIGTIELRTTDNYLYNYKIDVNKIKVSLTATGDVSFQIKALCIAGTYEIWASSKTEYTGEYKITIDGKEVYKEKIVTQQAYAYKMQFKNCQNFKEVKSTSNEHWYEFIGEFTSSNLEFEFQILDDGNGVIKKSDYFQKYTEITYMENGKSYCGSNYYEITYQSNGNYYKFVDKFKYESKTYTWVFYFKEGNKQVKYYITYDQSRIKQQIAVEKSYFTIVTGEIKINNYVTIDVFLKDGNDAFMGITKGKLEELKNNVVVKALKTDGSVAFTLTYNQITSSYAIRYQYLVNVGGSFKIVAYYKNQELKCSISNNSIKITVAEFSLKNSLFSIILDKTIKMESGTEVTIENENQIPRFKLELRTSTGESTTYTTDNQFSLFIEKSGTTSVKFTEAKTNNYVEFNFDYSYQQVFKTLSGEYTLTLSSGSQSVSWKIHLLGDGNEYSDEKEFDLSKTYIEPTNPVATAGQEVIINIQLRGKDGKRWKYETYNECWKFKLENSFNLEKGKDIEYSFNGEWNNLGVVVLKIKQNIITEDKYNVLTIKFEDKYTFATKINLKVKSGKFSKLKIVGNVVEGDVTNLPYIKFMPVDCSGNLVYDFFDGSVTQEYLQTLTVGKSLEGVSLISNNYVSEKKYLIVQYKSTISTNVKVTSQYFCET